jgi:hypothetical protein
MDTFIRGRRVYRRKSITCGQSKHTTTEHRDPSLAHWCNGGSWPPIPSPFSFHDHRTPALVGHPHHQVEVGRKERRDQATMAAFWGVLSVIHPGRALIVIGPFSWALMVWSQLLVVQGVQLF